MKNECSIVCDLLPLYLENMVSEDTAAFVKEHLESCAKCSAEFEAMKAGEKMEKISNEIQNETEAESLKVMKAIRKKLRKEVHRKDAIRIAIIVTIFLVIYCFPVYRIVNFGSTAFDGFYTSDEIVKAFYIGSPFERMEARSVLRLAEQAFDDVNHTHDENEEKYGILSRYATNVELYGEVSHNEHSLKLWSAHLGKDEGWIWVYYSSESFRHDGSTARGSWRIPSLWKVEKNDSGKWDVVDIIEHP